jgi:hypothetical protein
VRVYETLSGGSSRVVVETIVEGPQTKLWATPIMLIGSGWDVTVEKLASTTRAIAWSLRTDARPGAPSFPALAHATTAGAIRDRIIEVIRALTPSVHTGNRFEVFRDEDEANFVEWAEAFPQGAFRRFQVRDLSTDGPPPVSNTDIEERLVTFTIAVAYPQTSRMGGDAARDRDDARTADRHLIERAIGMAGRANFSSPHPDACWRADGSGSELVTRNGVDFLVITQTMSFQMQFS